MQDHRRIDEIEIGKRHRRDMGDIPALAASIQEFGLLHPVVVSSTGKLIAGERRLRAAMLLGWEDIAVHIVDVAAILNCEVCENEERKGFTYSEAVSIARELKPAIAAAALERKALRNPANAERLKGTPRGKTGDIVAPFTSKGRESLKRAEELVAAAEADPARFGHLVEEMDRTNAVMRPWQTMRKMIRDARPPTPEEIRGVARADRWKLLRDGLSYIDQLPPPADVISIIRQHDPHERYVTPERVEKIVAWLGDLGRLLSRQDHGWRAPRKRQARAQASEHERA